MDQRARIIDEDLIVDLNIKVWNRGSYFDVTIKNNGTPDQWTNQFVADTAIDAAMKALDHRSVRYRA